MHKLLGMTENCQFHQYWQANSFQAADNGKIFREETIFPKYKAIR